MPSRNGSTPPPWPTGEMSPRARTRRLIAFASWCGGYPPTYLCTGMNGAADARVRLHNLSRGLGELAAHAAAEAIHELYGNGRKTRKCRKALFHRLALLGHDVPELVLPPEASL